MNVTMLIINGELAVVAACYWCCAWVWKTWPKSLIGLKIRLKPQLLQQCQSFLIVHQKYVGTFYNVTIQKNKGEVFCYDLQKAIRSTV